MRQSADTGWWDLTELGTHAAVNLHEYDLESCCVSLAGRNGQVTFDFSSGEQACQPFRLTFTSVRDLTIEGEDLLGIAAGQVTRTDSSGTWFSLQTVSLTMEFRADETQWVEILVGPGHET